MSEPPAPPPTPTPIDTPPDEASPEDSSPPIETPPGTPPPVERPPDTLGPAHSPAPRWVRWAAYAALLLELVDLVRIFARPLVPDHIQQTWWLLFTLASTASATLALAGLAAWRRHLGWALAAAGAGLVVLIWIHHTWSFWGRVWGPSLEEVLMTGLHVLAEVLVIVGVLLARRTAAPWLGTVYAALSSTAAATLVTMITALLTLYSVGPRAYDLARPLWELGYVGHQATVAIGPLIFAGLLWSALHPAALRRTELPYRGFTLLGVGVAGALASAAACSHALLQAQQQHEASWRTLAGPAAILPVALQVAGAALLAAGLVALRHLGRPLLGPIAAGAVIATSGLAPLARLLLGDPDAAGFSPLTAAPLALLLVVVVSTRRLAPRPTALAAGIALGLATLLAALSTDGLGSRLYGLDPSQAASGPGGVAMAARSLTVVTAYGLLAFHLAQLRPPETASHGN